MPGETQANNSQIFQPYRALGYVTNHVPFSLLARGPETYVTTSIGNAFHIYDCKKLNLLFVGPQLAEDISCIVAYENYTITACENKLAWFERGKKILGFKAHNAAIHSMITFGQHLLTVCDDNILKIWNVVDGELDCEIPISPSFTVTTIMHPSTYLNKILLGSREGKLQLWNIRTRKLIYEFEGWGSEIVCCVQAPAVDVVGLGLQDGRIIIYNIRYDSKVIVFNQEFGPITGLSFRTDEHPVLASTAGGRIMLWDLQNRKLMTTVPEPHNGQITSLEFLHGQPILMTSSADNSLKMWIFDQHDGNPRLLRSRSGHSAPPTRLQYYDEEGKFMLSSGMDKSLRLVSSIRDAQNIEFSQGSVAKKAKKFSVASEDLKLSPIVDFSSATTRERDWDNIVTCHLQSLEVKTWRYSDKVIGKHSLSPPAVLEVGKIKVDSVVATAVTLSTCGNFVFVGLSNGQIDRYNIQSGNHRGMYGKPAHENRVRGICTDAINGVMISGGVDGNIKFWDFQKRKLLGVQKLDTPVAIMKIQRETSILGVACDDFNIRFYDVDSKRLIRFFSGHSNRITDLAFSPDGRWVVSSSMDGNIRVWDIPAGRLLDNFLVRSPVTSLAFSPASHFLATTHIDCLGVYLWANKTVFSNNSVKFLPNDFQANYVDLPTVGDFELEKEQNGLYDNDNDNDNNNNDDDDDDNGIDVDNESDGSSSSSSSSDDDDDDDDDNWVSPTQIGNGLTLSSKPSSYWQTLSNLEQIKQRNKPTEAPQVAPDAPFFLPTASTLEGPKFIKDDNEMQNEIEKKNKTESDNSRIMNFGTLDLSSPFIQLLKSCCDEEDYEPLWNLLNEMSPSHVDVEIRNVSTIESMRLFLCFLASELSNARNFELLQAYLSLFLKLNGHVISEDEGLLCLLNELQEQHRNTWEKVNNMMNHSLCLVDFMKSM